MRIGRAEQGRQHPLQSPDENIGLAAPLGELFDLRVFGRDLPAQKFDFAFEARDIAWFEFRCRDKLRHVAQCRTRSLRYFRCVGVALGRGWARCVDEGHWLNDGRDPVRHVVLWRALSHFVGDAVQLGKLGDRPRDRIWGGEIGEPGCRLFLDTIEPAGGAVSLERANIAGKPRLGEEASSLVEREGKACRSRARCVGLCLSFFVGHCRYCNTGAMLGLCLSP